MKFTTLLLILSLFFAASCSSSKKSEGEVEEGQEITDAIDGESDFVVDGDDEELVIEEESVALEESDDVALDNVEEVKEVAAAAPESTAKPVINEHGTYTLKNGETLMMVAFNVYGDYRRWREIAEHNGIRQNDIKAGMKIKYIKPTSAFQWNPEGLPYLIKRGDSLASISNDKYGTIKKWRMIYDNNRPLIKDPNLIFAGFTLYYVPLRDVASKQ